MSHALPKRENILFMTRTAKGVYTIQRVPKGQSHPYTRYEKTPLWRAIDRAVIDLIENRDLFEDEYHDYIVGYICKVINRRRDPIIAQLKSNSHS